jgi:hypothetical protein
MTDLAKAEAKIAAYNALERGLELCGPKVRKLPPYMTYRPR